VGNAQLYTVNMESEVTKLISAFQLSLAEIEIKKQLNKEKIESKNKSKNVEVSSSK